MYRLDGNPAALGSNLKQIKGKHWRALVASLLAVGVTGTAWAGAGDGERLRIAERVVDGPCEARDGRFGNLVARKRAFLGVELTEMTPELRRHFGVPEESGVLVSRVVEGSPAARAGLAVGDIVSRVGDKAIEGTWRLTTAIRAHEPGEPVDLEYWRDGGARSVTVTLDEREGCVYDISEMVGNLEELRLELPEIHAEGLRISEEAISQAFEALEKIDWNEQLKGLEALEMDGEFDLRMEEMQREMEELSRRLAMEMEENGLHMEEAMRDREMALREVHKERIRSEREVRRELERARAEAQKAMHEAEKDRARALEEAHRELAEARSEMEQEARMEAEEALREAHEEMMAAQEEMRRAQEEALQEALEEMREAEEQEEDGKVLL